MAALDASSNPDWRHITRGVDWTRAILHALACTEGQSCCYRNCRDIKSLLLHIFSSTYADCEAEAKRRKESGQSCPQTHAGICPSSLLCQPVRYMINHWLTCKEYDCAICITLWADILRTEQAQQTGGTAGGNTFSGRPEKKSCSPGPMPNSSTSGTPEEALLAAAIQTFFGAGFSSQMSAPASQPQLSHHPSSDSQQAYTSSCQSSEDPGSEGSGTKIMDIPSLEELVRCLIQKTTVDSTQPNKTAWLKQGKDLWSHILLDCSFAEGPCPYPGCQHARIILRHRTECQVPWCLFCAPLKGFLSPEQQQGGKRKKKK